jgi:DNA-binding response OmpR family regulator
MNQRTVFVVDDEDPISRLIEVNLRNVGYESVCNGREALVLLEMTNFDLV